MVAQRASAAGIPFVGVLGVLARAKREGLLTELRPLIDRLRGELRFRIAENFTRNSWKRMAKSCEDFAPSVALGKRPTFWATPTSWPAISVCLVRVLPID